ncbi:MAG: glycosyltransferase family 39 protein, partial [Candidatus Promineifilaceae bacterium]
RPLWLDEAMEYWVATAPLDQLTAVVKDALQDPPLYSLVLSQWLHLGRDEFTLRSLTAFVSVLSVAAAYAFGRQVYGRRTGLIAALLFAVLPPHIRMAQEVGQYAFLVFLLLLNLLMLVYARRTNDKKYWAVWMITAVAGAYNYYGSLLVILPAAAVVFLENLVKRKTADLRNQAAASLIFVLTALPLFLFWLPDQLFRGPVSDKLQLNFSTFTNEVTIFLARTQNLLAYQLTSYLITPEEWKILRLAAWLLLLFALLFALYGLRKSSKYAYVLLWLLAAGMAYYIAGRLGAYPYGGTRHALILAPLLIPIVAIGLSVMWDTWPPLSALALLGILIIAMLSPVEGPEDARSVVAQFLARHEENVPAYVYYNGVPAVRYQMGLQQGVVEDIPADWFRTCWAGEASPYCEQDNILYGRWMRSFTAEERINGIFQALGPDTPEAFWLIFSHTGEIEQEELFNLLAPQFAIEEAFEAPGAAAYLLYKR